jgi:hypothetical protein
MRNIGNAALSPTGRALAFLTFESEAEIFAKRFASIARLRAEGAVSEERARSHVEFQKEAWWNKP